MMDDEGKEERGSADMPRQAGISEVSTSAGRHAGLGVAVTAC